MFQVLFLLKAFSSFRRFLLAFPLSVLPFSVHFRAEVFVPAKEDQNKHILVRGIWPSKTSKEESNSFFLGTEVLLPKPKIGQIGPVLFTSPACLFQKGRHCKNTWKAEREYKIKYDSCESIKAFRPKYCATCKRHRCCSPDQTKTISLEFECGHNHDRITVHDFMWIKSCVCKDFCP